MHFREIPAAILVSGVWLHNFQIVSVNDETGAKDEADLDGPKDA